MGFGGGGRQVGAREAIELAPHSLSYTTRAPASGGAGDNTSTDPESDIVGQGCVVYLAIDLHPSDVHRNWRSRPPDII